MNEKNCDFGIACLFFAEREIWAKCKFKKCGEWNLIAKGGEISDIKPSPNTPILMTCDACEGKTYIQSIRFAPKGMRKPR